jgi:hypothetical protein
MTVVIAHGTLTEAMTVVIGSGYDHAYAGEERSGSGEDRSAPIAGPRAHGGKRRNAHP